MSLRVSGIRHAYEQEREIVELLEARERAVASTRPGDPRATREAA